MKRHYIKTREGSYKSNCFGNPQEIYLDNYWSNENNRSTIHQQIGNVQEKNELVKKELRYIGKFLEIACAPGLLMRDVSEYYESVTGIEVDPKFISQIKEIAPNSEIIEGYFPAVTAHLDDNLFHDIVALDVIEHVEDGQGFVNECSRLLVSGGKLIIQAPILMSNEYELPEHQFNEIEHIWIYHIDHLKAMARKAGMAHVSSSVWKAGHEQVTFIKA